MWSAVVSDKEVGASKQGRGAKTLKNLIYTQDAVSRFLIKTSPLTHLILHVHCSPVYSRVCHFFPLHQQFSLFRVFQVPMRTKATLWVTSFYETLNKHKISLNRNPSQAKFDFILSSSLQFLPQTQPGGFVYPPQQQQQGGFPQGGGYPPQQVRRSYNVKPLGFHIFLLRRAMLLLSRIHLRNLSLPWPLFNRWEDVELKRR